jgi:hypothetical protein
VKFSVTRRNASTDILSHSTYTIEDGWMIEVGLLKLLDRPPSSHIDRTRNQSGFGVEFANRQNNPCFWEQGVKINQEGYHRNILEAFVYLWSQWHFSNQEWIFQQDSTLSHKVKATHTWLRTCFRNSSALKRGRQTHRPQPDGLCRVVDFGG